MLVLAVIASCAAAAMHAWAADVVCRHGHWPLQQSCWLPDADAILSGNSTHPMSITLHGRVEDSLVRAVLQREWPDIQYDDTDSVTSHANRVIEEAVLFPIPFDPSLYAADGSNYYVMHVDVLIPLFQFLRLRALDRHPTVPIHVIPIVMTSGGRAT